MEGSALAVVSDQLAIFAPALGLELPRDAFGKDIANRGLFQALAQHGGFSRMHWLTADPASQASLQQAFLPNGGSTKLLSTDLLDLYAPCLSGVLLRGQPYLADLAWMRGAFRHHHSYSLVGLIHTLAPPAVREQIGAVTVAPLQPWDALICTSPSVRRAVEAMLDQWEAHLAQRLGASRFTRPQLPLIPLGVDRCALELAADDAAARHQLRQQLGLHPHELLVLWVGRLSYFEKAYPQPMFQALQRAAQQLNGGVHFAMVGWFPGGESDQRLYREAAERYCPNVPVHWLDGRDQELVRRCWAAADLFLSLVDNPQETFGLSPVEAMAAGLPVVVSDWDGYRFTVGHGREGCLIPTLGGASGGIGDELATRHSLGLMSYQDYVGAVAQHTAVDVEAAAAALVRLGADANLRRAMGEAGRRNVRERFDWSVVAGHYRRLFEELQQRRLSNSSAEARQLHPLRANPFSDFAGFATTQLELDTRLELACELETALAALGQLTRLDRCYQGCHAQLGELQQLLQVLHHLGPSGPGQLLASFEPGRHQPLLLGLSWMAKLGLLRWRHQEPIA